MPNAAVLLLLGLIVGMVLGLLGGGGGVVAVPLLVAAGLALPEAQGASLLVVLLGSLTALVLHHRAGQVDWRLGLTFGGLGTLGSLAGARLSLGLPVRGQLAGFALLLILAAAAMVRRSSGAVPDETPAANHTWPRVIALATGVGLTTGFFGVGGGFIAVPAMTAALKIPVKRAGATALVVIAINTTVALFARIDHLPTARTMAYLAITAMAGSVIGAVGARRVSAGALKRGFALLCLVAAIYSLAKALG